MSEHAVVRTESLGGSPLSRAARGGELAQWYRSAPADVEQWAQYVRDVAASVSGDWFDDLRAAIAPTGAAFSRLSRSAGGQGVVITTGQQPGLFGGPLMTLVKAISARALADVLGERTGMQVAPLFWAATDDADFDEAAGVSVALDGGAKELRLERRAPAGTPMARVPIDREIEAHAAVLRDACGSSPHRSYLDAALSSFRDGATLGDAYTALLRTILEPLEIAVLDASHPDVTRRATPLLRKAAANGDDIATATHRRIDEIVGASFRPQVEEVPGLSMVFLNSNGTKRRLPLREAAAFADSRDAFLSATVLLRPVVERAIVPTAAYVAGPGEFAYFAQVSAVAERLGVPTPFVVPRWSATIVEPRVQHILNELGLAVEDLSDPHAADSRIARARLSPETGHALRTLRDELRHGIDGLRRSNEGIVPDRTLESLQRTIEHRLERTERRFVAGVKRAEGETMRRLATARGSLFPHGTRQERMLAYIPFLARYGPEVLHQMLASARVHATAIVDTPAEQASPVVSR
jgi:bacillithiol biosynthesis cysteine-adding enzyme BshC